MTEWMQERKMGWREKEREKCVRVCVCVCVFKRKTMSRGEKGRQIDRQKKTE